MASSNFMFNFSGIGIFDFSFMGLILTVCFPAANLFDRDWKSG